MNADVSKWRKGCCQSGVKVVFGWWKSLLHFFVSSDDLKCTGCYSRFDCWELQGVLEKGCPLCNTINTNNNPNASMIKISYASLQRHKWPQTKLHTTSDTSSFSGTDFHALSHGVIHFVWSVGLRNNFPFALVKIIQQPIRKFQSFFLDTRAK